MKQRKEGLGKRRRAREMALQMLYQRDLGGAPLAEIVAAFDLSDYVAETERAMAEGDDGDAPAADAPAPDDHSQVSHSQVSHPQIEDSFDYARRLLAGVEEHAATIDEQIRHHAENWRLERMPVIDRNILRLAIYEMLFESNVPKVVIVDEAIELAKKFGSENSGRFVNGLLDGVLKGAPGESP